MPQNQFCDTTAGTYMRSGVIPGGMRMESGCYTFSDATDLKLPSHFLDVVSVVINVDGTCQVIAAAEMSGSFIKASTSGTCESKVVNYIALGW